MMMANSIVNVKILISRRNYKYSFLENVIEYSLRRSNVFFVRQRMYFECIDITYKYPIGIWDSD